MRESVRLAIQLSELRESLNGFPEDGESEKRDALVADYTKAESEFRAALVKEDSDSGPARNSADGEGAELRRMKRDANFGQYVAAAAGRRGVQGIENELNQALGIGELSFPLEMLAPEFRAAIDGDSETNQAMWLDRVFHESAAQRLGISFRSVASGIASYPVTTAGGTPQQRARAQVENEGTFTVGVTEMKPTRKAVHLVYTIEDAARLPGLADAIQRDMRMAMVERVDRSIFRGDTSATGTDADITGLETASIDESTITQANKILGPATLGVFAAYIDGQYAASPADLRVVAAEGANTLWMTTVINSTASNETLGEFLRRAGVNWTVRGDIETATANNDFGAFVGLARGIDGAGIAAVWEDAQMIVDPYTNAAKGEVSLVLNYLWNFGLPRTANYKRIKFVT